MKLQDVGHAHNINLITPEHVVPQVALSILQARELGLRLPIIYNTSAFDSLASLELFDGLVDIYLPDFKVWKDSTSKRLLKADKYTSAAMDSIKAMHAQVGDLCFTADGLAKKGVLVRHLVMPGKEDEGQEIVKWLADNVSNDIYVHIMEQYQLQMRMLESTNGGPLAVLKVPNRKERLPSPNLGDYWLPMLMHRGCAMRRSIDQCPAKRYLVCA